MITNNLSLRIAGNDGKYYWRNPGRRHDPFCSNLEKSSGHPGQDSGENYWHQILALEADTLRSCTSDSVL